MVGAAELPHCYPAGEQAVAPAAEGGDSLGGGLVDLFDGPAATAALGPSSASACFEATLRPGELIFTPSKCAHAVMTAPRRRRTAT